MKKLKRNIVTVLMTTTALSACSIFDYNPDVYIPGIYSYIDNFPTLNTKVILMSKEEMLKHCDQSPIREHLGETLACAKINFKEETCIIHITENHERWVLDHELAHCKGGDHDDGSMEKNLALWKEGQKIRELMATLKDKERFEKYVQQVKAEQDKENVIRQQTQQ